jgi:hypothetical protein
VRLTWSDLLIDRVAEADFRSWISPWAGTLSGEFGLAFLNKFGVWFLRRPEGPVDMLDVFSGEVERIAETYERFIAGVNDRFWQETYLLSEVVLHLRDVGKVPGPGECYALAPHPAATGASPMHGEPVDPERVTTMPVGEWQAACARAVPGRRG